jgi:hypothetical protein
MAPRANWKGFLRLSLVTCPVALYPATSESEKISFNQSFFLEAGFLGIMLFGLNRVGPRLHFFATCFGQHEGGPRKEHGVRARRSQSRPQIGFSLQRVADFEDRDLRDRKYSDGRVKRDLIGLTYS